MLPPASPSFRRVVLPFCRTLLSPSVIELGSSSTRKSGKNGKTDALDCNFLRPFCQNGWKNRPELRKTLWKLRAIVANVGPQSDEPQLPFFRARQSLTLAAPACCAYLTFFYEVWVLTVFAPEREMEIEPKVRGIFEPPALMSKS